MPPVPLQWCVDRFLTLLWPTTQPHHLRAWRLRRLLVAAAFVATVVLLVFVCAWMLKVGSGGDGVVVVDSGAGVSSGGESNYGPQSFLANATKFALQPGRLHSGRQNDGRDFNRTASVKTDPRRIRACPCLIAPAWL